MTEYSSVPEVNALYQQREIITNAIAILDTGGSLSSISIAPPPGMMMAAPIGSNVALQPPTPPNVVADVRAVLVTMQADIDAQLAALGVTATPPQAAKAAAR